MKTFGLWVQEFRLQKVGGVASAQQIAMEKYWHLGGGLGVEP